MYRSWQERDAKRKANKKQHKEIRSANRKKSIAETERLMSYLRSYVRDCGLTQTQLADFSGVDTSTVSQIMRRYHMAARFNVVVAMARAAGYRIEFIKEHPRRDEFRDERRLKPPPLDEKTD